MYTNISLQLTRRPTTFAQSRPGSSTPPNSTARPWGFQEQPILLTYVSEYV